MKNYQGPELSAYEQGIHAAYRTGEYTGKKDIQCPYGASSKEGEAWKDGFGDGTDDLIYANEAE